MGERDQEVESRCPAMPMAGGLRMHHETYDRVA